MRASHSFSAGVFTVRFATPAPGALALHVTTIARYFTLAPEFASEALNSLRAEIDFRRGVWNSTAHADALCTLLINHTGLSISYV
jgi:hypothetical protein